MPRTGHDFVFDETVLDPHYEPRMATFLLKARPQTYSFGTRHWRGRRARGCGRAGGREDARLGRAVAAEREKGWG